MTWIKTYIATHRKALVSLYGGILAWGVVVQNTGLNSAAWWALAIVFGHYLGVSAVANDPAPTAGLASHVTVTGLGSPIQTSWAAYPDPVVPPDAPKGE